MLKNKIYNYLTKEIAKTFIIILFAFTTIAWTVRAVNFLDLMIEDGYTISIYLQYSLFNLSTILTRFIPLAFLISLIVGILKFERQQELLILWTIGLSKIKIANLFFSIALIVTVVQIILAFFINPSVLYKSRILLKESTSKQISSVIKSNDFSDSFKNVTFYVDNKNDEGEMTNIFIRDNTNALSTIIAETEGNNNTTIIAKKGIIIDRKLILFEGLIQTENKTGEIKNIDFEKTELALDGFATRTITQPKMQETSSLSLIECLTKNKLNENIRNCPYTENKKEVIETLARRIGMPLYIPLVAIIASFLLIHKKEKKINFLKKYIFFIIAFMILIFAEIMVRFSGQSPTNSLIYFLFPFALMPILYLMLLKTIMSERKI